ncbi:MAG TPA: hypothetical protein VFG28_13315 [Syntrophales bacterium]|nr:hypothetical protein [Syntrophales bacterium]
MKRTTCCRILFLLLLALFGCAGVLQEEAAKPQEPVPQPAVIAPPPAPVPDESEMIRDKAKDMLLGKWKRQALGDDTIEFMEDGTVVLYSAVERVAYPGSYRILDKDQLEITMKKGGSLTWGYAVTKGDLTLTTPTGVDMKYKRMRSK